MTRYRTIVADPPWPISDLPKFGYGYLPRRSEVVCPYPTMTLDEIKALPVREIADRRSHLYLWTITAYLWDAPSIARAWGFEPSALLTWCKPDRPGGLGGTFPANTEYIVFCSRDWKDDRVLMVTAHIREAQTRMGIKMGDIDREFGFRRADGRPSQMSWHWVTDDPTQAQIPTIAQWPKLRDMLGITDGRIGALVDELHAESGQRLATGRANSRWFRWPVAEHSRKPDAFLDLVEQVSPGPYLELFARRQRLGWDTWGDEALEHVELGA